MRKQERWKSRCEAGEEEEDSVLRNDAYKIEISRRQADTGLAKKSRKKGTRQLSYKHFNEEEIFCIESVCVFFQNFTTNIYYCYNQKKNLHKRKEQSL